MSRINYNGTKETSCKQDKRTVPLSSGILGLTLGGLAHTADAIAETIAAVVNTVAGKNLLYPRSAYKEYLDATDWAHEKVASKLNSPSTFYLGLEFANALTYATGVALQVFGTLATISQFQNMFSLAAQALLGSSFMASGGNEAILAVSAVASVAVVAVGAGVAAVVAAAALVAAVTIEGAQIKQMATDHLQQNEVRRQGYQQEYGCGGSSSGTGKLSSLPVPEETTASNGLKYQSNPKHTPGQPGYNSRAGIEPQNSLDLFSESVVSRQKPNQRFAYDPQTGTLHRFFNDGHGVWHWSGSTNQGVNSLTSSQVPSDIIKWFDLPRKGW